MLTIADIPDRYRKGETDGDNIARLASGVQAAVAEAVGEDGSLALLRFVTAGFHFRSSEIGFQMVSQGGALAPPILETSQLVSFAGASLAAMSLVAALDLTAAALYRLHHGLIDARDPGREADLMSYPLATGPPDVVAWLKDTRGNHSWAVLRGVREQVAHRFFPIHVTVAMGSAVGVYHHLDIDGERKDVRAFLLDSRAFVIDRLVSAGLMIDRHASEMQGRLGSQ